MCTATTPAPRSLSRRIRNPGGESVGLSRDLFFRVQVVAEVPQRLLVRLASARHAFQAIEPRPFALGVVEALDRARSCRRRAAHELQEFLALQQLDHALRLVQSSGLDQHIRQMPVDDFALEYQCALELRLERCRVGTHLLHDVDGAFRVQDRRVAFALLREECAVGMQGLPQLIRPLHDREDCNRLLEEVARASGFACATIRFTEHPRGPAELEVCVRLRFKRQHDLSRAQQRLDRLLVAPLQQQRATEICVRHGEQGSCVAQLLATDFERATMHAFGFAVAALRVVDRTQSDQYECERRVVRAEHALADRERFVEHVLGALVLADVVIDHGVFVEDRGMQRFVAATSLFGNRGADGERLFERAARIGETTEHAIRRTEAVQIRRQRRGLHALGSTSQRQCALQRRCGGGMIAFAASGHRDRIECSAGYRNAGIGMTLRNFVRTLEQLIGRGGLAPDVQQRALTYQRQDQPHTVGAFGGLNRVPGAGIKLRGELELSLPTGGVRLLHQQGNLAQRCFGRGGRRRRAQGAPAQGRPTDSCTSSP